MISSTVLDLPEHRDQVMRGCLKGGFEPVMMENASATDATAVEVSRAMVDAAAVYICVLGSRYGTVPPGEQRSITEIEYERAVERDIPRLLFLMDQTKHPLLLGDVDLGAVDGRLEALRARMTEDRAPGMFVDPQDLHNQVLKSLLTHAQHDGAALHAVTDAPAPPRAYVAHPYTLLETRDLVGRQAELNLLTEWVTRSDAPSEGAPVFVFEAVGGMGKSALTWKWFREIAPQEMAPLAGSIWWSFYESDASYENFLIRSLAYATQRSFEQVRALTVTDREEQLLRVLDEWPFLIVLDGIERILRAYARRGAIQAIGATEADDRQHLLRRTIDPRAGAFLRRLTRIGASRVLISTRLFPSELQTEAGKPLPGVLHEPLEGLSDDDAVRLWRELGVSGSRADLLAVFHTFDNYPLLIRVLAGEVARFRQAPGDFAAWRKHHPDFNPFGLPLTQVRSHVLEFAFRGLSDRQGRLLNTLAAFRSPVPYDVLRAMTVQAEQVYDDEVDLARDLDDLEDRGLVGWDQRGNRYDQHPIVRGVAWTALDPRSRQTIHLAFDTYFASLPTPAADAITSVDELYGPLEHYHALVELHRYEDAWALVMDRLVDPLIKLDEWALIADQVEPLFDAESGLPRDLAADELAFGCLLIGLSLHFTGQLDRAIPFWHKVIAFSTEAEAEAVAAGLIFLSHSLCARGALAEAAAAGERALALAASGGSADEEVAILARAALARLRGLLGSYSEADEVLREVAVAEEEDPDMPPLMSARGELARNALRWGDLERAVDYAKQTWALAEQGVSRPANAEAAVAQGAVALARDELQSAEEWLGHGLEYAASARIPSIELLALLGYGELERRRGNLDAARDRLEEIVELAKRGPFVLELADAHHLRALVDRDDGDLAGAAEWARESFRMAWADGPPYAYAWGLERARALLEELGVPEPDDLKPFDPVAPAGALDEQITARERERLLERVRSDDPAARRLAVSVLGHVGGAEALAAIRGCLGDEDPDVRLTALRGLGDGAMPLAEFAEMLLRMCEDDAAPVRLAAVEAMRFVPWTPAAGGEDAVPGAASILRGLVARVHDEDAAVRALALSMLASAGDDDRLTRDDLSPLTGVADRVAIVADAVPSGTILAASRDDSPHVRAAAVSAMRLERHAGRDARLRELLDDPEPSVRLAVIERLQDAELDEAVRARLLACLHDEAAAVRAAVVALLASLRWRDELSSPSRAPHDSEFSEELIRLADDPDPHVAAAVASALRGQCDPPAVAALAGLLGHVSKTVRAVALRVAGQQMHPDFTAPMLECLDDIDSPQVARALASVGGEQVTATLLARLADPLPHRRQRAAELLRELQDPSTVPRLMAALDDEHDPVVHASARALGGLGDAVPTPPLVARLTADRPTVRRAVAELLGELGRNDATEDLVTLLGDATAEVRFASALALAQLKDPRGRDTILALSRDEDDAVRLESLNGFSAISGADVRERLLAMTKDPSDGVQTRAVELLVAAIAPDDESLVPLLRDAGPTARRRALAYAARPLSHTERVLLTRDADGLWPYLDPAAPIDEAQVAALAGRFQVEPAEVRKRFEVIAERIPLVLSWHSAG